MAGLGFTRAKQYDLAFRYLLKAAELGNVSAQSLTGENYLLGEGTPMNYSKAFEWLSKASDHQDASAESALGMIYRFGMGVPINYTLAEFWYTQAAAHGDRTARADLQAMKESQSANQTLGLGSINQAGSGLSAHSPWQRATLVSDVAADGVSLRRCSYRSLNGYGFSTNRNGVCPVLVEVDPVTNTSRDVAH